jgi:hypothetical protein
MKKWVELNEQKGKWKLDNIDNITRKKNQITILGVVIILK